MNVAEALNAVVDRGTHFTVLHGLRGHADAVIRAGVAAHPQVSDLTLRDLIHDSDVNVLLAVHLNARAHVLHRTIAGWNYARLVEGPSVTVTA